MRKIKKGDCLELIKSLPDAYVDMVLTDLPYGVTRNKWDIPIDLSVLWPELYRVSKHNATFVFNAMQPFTSDLIYSNRKAFKYCWVWDKRNPKGFLNARRQPLRRTEDIVVFYRKQPKYNPQMSKGKPFPQSTRAQSDNYGNFSTVKEANLTGDRFPTTLLPFPVPNVGPYKHPTGKPVALNEYLIKTYTDEGEIILDVCMGTGSTGVAAIQTGRGFVGFEKDAEYFSVAAERLKKTIRAT